MQIKNFFVSVISIVLILGTTGSVFAQADSSVGFEKVVRVVDAQHNKPVKENEAKTSKHDAIEIAKKTLKSYFDYEIDEKKFESRVEFREDYGMAKGYAWSIDWHMYNEENSINIDIWVDDSTGKVMRISKKEYDHSEDEATIAQITEPEAMILADNFIKRVNPQEYKEVKLEEDKYAKYWRYNSTNYHFTYTRQINDISFEGNSISVEVDGIKGEVISYSYNWDDDTDFPSLQNIVDKDKAEKVIKDNMDMRLSYIAYRDRYDYYEEKVDEVKLVYNPRFHNGYMVDAKEGIMIDDSGEVLEEERIKNITDERKEEIGKKAKEIINFGTEISQERANQVIEKYIKDIYGEGYEIESLRYAENDDYWENNGKKSWGARFVKNEGFKSHEDGGNITINALTEELISVYRYDDLDDKLKEDYNPVIAWEEGYDKAIEVIEKYFPGKIKNIDTEATYRKHTHYYNGKKIPEIEYYYNFDRKVNDIYYSEDRISVIVDTKEGKIREIRCNWNDDAKFPEARGVISEEDATKIVFKDYELELVYTKANNSNDYKNSDWEIKLVYRLPLTYFGGNIDAFTGKFLDSGGKEITEADSKFKEKIKGHEFEKELSILASQGIINLEGFELDKEMTRAEAIKMLVYVKGYKPYIINKAEDLKFSNIAQEDENYKYLQMAVIYGILENKEEKFKSEEKITREELAEMMVNLLGYSDLAKLNDIFKVSYSDASSISKDRVGSVAICKGLNIMKDKDGKFKPKYNVTMVDMAVAIYNAFGNLEK